MSPGVKRPGSGADDSLYLVSRLKPAGEIPSHPLANIAHIQKTLPYLMKRSGRKWL